MVKKSKKKSSEVFSEKKQKRYERLARLQYGPEIVNESIARWNGYSKKKQEKIMAESGEVYSDLAKALEAGKSPTDPEVQAILPRWHNSIRHFYEPTLEILRGLGEMYNSDPEFIATFTQWHPRLAEYLQAAITEYVEELERVEIERLLAEDERRTARLTGNATQDDPQI